MINVMIDNRPDIRYNDCHLSDAVRVAVEAIDDPDVGYVCLEFLAETKGPEQGA